MSSVRVNVVLGALNEERLIGDAIGSVLAQTFGEFDLTVVDDGSTDRTARVVESFVTRDDRVRLVRHPENRGFSRALNTGIRAGGAEYVAMIDADDLWMPEYLEKLVARLDGSPEAGFAFTEAWWMDAERGRFYRRSTSEYLGAPTSLPSDPIELLDSIIPANWIFGLTTMRRSVLEDLGGFDESLAACEDYDLWIRMLSARKAGVAVWEKLAIQRDRHGSMSTVQASMFSNLERVLRPVCANTDLPDHTRRLARRRVADLQDAIATLGGERRTHAVALALRGAAGRARKRLLPGRVWLHETPPEVASAFPEFG